MKKTSKAVGILGMHRSGTSMITRTLNYLGVELGKESGLQIRGKRFNPEGYWEHKGIMLRQRQILKVFSRSWDTHLPLPDNWWKYKAIVPYKIRLKEIVRNEFSTKELWGWKDPGTSLLLPMWQELLHELNIPVSYVIVIRNPLDVAASLHNRNNFSKKKSFNIWCLYTLSALIGSEHSHRIIIHYDQFINNLESKTEEVCTWMGLETSSLEEVQKSLKSFVNPDLQHSKSSVEDLINEKDTTSVIATLYQLILKAEKEPVLLNDVKFNRKIQEIYKELYGK